MRSSKNFTNRPKWAQNIVKYRKAAGLTQAGLGDQVGVSGVSIRRFELGLARPSFVTMNKIASVLGIKYTDILNPVENAGDTSEYLGKQLSHYISHYMPESYVISADDSGSQMTGETVKITYGQGTSEEVSLKYKMTDLIQQLADIKTEVMEKYEQEYRKSVNQLFKQILPPPKHPKD